MPIKEQTLQEILLHIGYHKTGTTWLQREGFSLLDGAERIRSTQFKAIALDIVKKDESPAITELREVIEGSSARHPIISFERFSGDIMAGASEKMRTAKRLVAAIPEARVLIVVRSQPAMLMSVHAQYVNQGGTGSFKEFLSGTAPGVEFNPDHLNYNVLVATYMALFYGKVLVLPYELLRDRPSDFLDRVADLLGTSLVGEITPSLINPSLSGTRLLLLRRWNRLARRSRFNPNPLLPIPGAWRLRRLLQSNAPVRRAVDERAVAFSARYEASNQRLAKWYDLTGWGYPGID